jgi:hypothetical protein
VTRAYEDAILEEASWLRDIQLALRDDISPVVDPIGDLYAEITELEDDAGCEGTWAALNPEEAKIEYREKLAELVELVDDTRDDVRDALADLGRLRMRRPALHFGDESNVTTACKQCGRTIRVRGGSGRQRTYCSDACRQRAYRERDRT